MCDDNFYFLLYLKIFQTDSLLNFRFNYHLLFYIRSILTNVHLYLFHFSLTSLVVEDYCNHKSEYCKFSRFKMLITSCNSKNSVLFLKPLKKCSLYLSQIVLLKGKLSDITNHANNVVVDTG